MPLITKGARALEVVARYGSIRKASEHINAAPSALNKQILNLEQEYGTPLFERLPRGMRLTEAGHVLVGQIRAWQDDNHRASAAVETLTIGPIVNGMLQRTAGEDVGAVMTNSISVLKSLVKQNQGISLLTRIDIQKEIQSSELIFKPLTGNRMFTTLSVAIRDEKALSPSSRQLVEIICSMLNDLAG